MSKATYSYPTKSGELKTTRKYSPRKSSGIVGQITFNLQYTDEEMVRLLKSIEKDVFDKLDIEATVFKKLTGDDIGREVKEVISEESMRPYVTKIEAKLKSDYKDISAEEFEQKLVAYADKTKLNKAQLNFLKKRFSFGEATSSEVDDIDF